MKKRAVVRDDGQQYSSVTEAAALNGIKGPTLGTAFAMTQRGFYYAVKRHQFAYADCVPKVWPASISGAKTDGDFPIFRSDGKRYRTMFEAAQDLGGSIRPLQIAKVVEVSRAGVYVKLAGYEFAFLGCVPGHWPIESQEQKPEEQKPEEQKPEEQKPEEQKPEEQEEQEEQKEQEDRVIYPSLTEEWKSIPGLPGYEVSINGYVREIGADTVLSRFHNQGVAEVRINGFRYSLIVLLMLTFAGPKPRGYELKKRSGTGVEASNLMYAPTTRGRPPE